LRRRLPLSSPEQSGKIFIKKERSAGGKPQDFFGGTVTKYVDIRKKIADADHET
jgi:hypothetical protein